MGSLFSSPKPVAIAAPQPYYVAMPPQPQPATTPAPSPTPSGSGGGTTPSTPVPETASQAGLLDRSRGILSTVLTGFDGILTNATTPQGKSLLGE
jgi:hypothetical protein